MTRERLASAGFTTVDFIGPSISDAWELQKQWTQIQDLSSLRKLLKNEPLTESVKRTGLITPPADDPPFSLEHLHHCHARIAQFVFLMVMEWQRTGIDLLILPNAAHTAVPFDEFTHLSFTSIFNLIDWPAVTLPLNDIVDRDLDGKSPESSDAQIAAPPFDAESYQGLPLSVQLVGRRFEDEHLLALAEHVHPVINGTVTN